VTDVGGDDLEGEIGEKKLLTWRKGMRGSKGLGKKS